MNKLDINIYDDIKDEYMIYARDIIEKNCKIYKSKLITKYFDCVTLEDIIKNNLNEILELNFGYIENTTNKTILNYFKTGQFISYSGFSITNELKRLGKKRTNKNKYQLRKKFFELFSNEWIDPFKKIHPHYYKNNINWNNMVKEIKNEFDRLNNDIKDIVFDSVKLDIYISSEMRHKILTSSKVTVCPYCDRQYISSYEDGKKSTADIDHFYMKSMFPLFAKSLYNFIPSCSICNRNFKSNKVKKILYPFKNGFGEDAKFRTSISNESDADTLFGKNDNFDLIIEVNENSIIKEEIQNNIDLFHLNSLYTIHKPYIKELFFKENFIYNDTYLKMMQNTFRSLDLRRNQLDLFLYGYTFDDTLDKDKLLKKLTKDILNK